MTKHVSLATFLFLTVSEAAVAAPAAQPKPEAEDPESILTAEELKACRSTRAGCWGVRNHKVRVAKKLAADVAAAFLLPVPKDEQDKP